MLLLIILHILLCMFLVTVILLQPGKSDGGIGFGGSSQSIFGGRGAGNFMTRTTSIVASVFLLTSFILTRHRIREDNRSVVTPVSQESSPAKPPVPPEVPAESSGGKSPEPAKGK